MKSISKFLLLLCIFILISVFIFENIEKEENFSEKEKVIKQLEEKGLPTPAYGSLKTLKNILKKHSAI